MYDKHFQVKMIRSKGDWVYVNEQWTSHREYGKNSA